MAEKPVGFIAVHRALKKHWIWQDATKLKWWLDILLEVNHAPASVNIGFELYVCGMSVPPVMMAQVAHHIYLQWITKML